MTRLPVVSGREATRAFGKLGYEIDRQHGSHLILRWQVAEKGVWAALRARRRNPLGGQAFARGAEKAVNETLGTYSACAAKCKSPDATPEVLFQHPAKDSLPIAA